MKRSWIGLGLLVLLLAASVTVTWGMNTVHRQVAQDLHRAAMSADPEQAENFVALAEDQWKQWHHFRSCFADQTPVEEIDAQFAKLRHCQQEERTSLAAETAQMVSAMGDAHDFTWWNFF